MGVSQEILEQAWKSLRKTKKPLFRMEDEAFKRHGAHPDAFRINKRLQNLVGNERQAEGLSYGIGIHEPELHGKYFGRTPLETEALIIGYPMSAGKDYIKEELSVLRDGYNRATDLNVQGFILPGKRHGVFNAKQWRNIMEWAKTAVPKKMLEESSNPGELINRRLTQELAKKYDAVTHPDLAMGNKDLYQTVILNKDSAIVRRRMRAGKKLTKEEALDYEKYPFKVHENGEWYEAPKRKFRYSRLGIPLAAGAGAAALAPEDSEAMPVKPLIKAGTKQAEKIMTGSNFLQSSAADRLVGETVGGRVVKMIKKGKGDWRNIVYEDGDIQPVTKDYIHSLAKHKGTGEYLEKFQGKSTKERIQQAMRSMQMRESKASKSPAIIRDEVRRLNKEHYERLNELNEKVEPHVMVQRGKLYYSMPKDYAELLQELDMVKIVYGTREKRVFKDIKMKGKK